MSELTAEQKDRLRAWVVALRSGEYEQGLGRLREPDDESYCCLGVACDVSGLGVWEGSHYRVGNDRSTTILPVPVADYYGVSQEPVLYEYTEDEVRAIEANDGLRWTFAQIADALERTYL